MIDKFYQGEPCGAALWVYKEVLKLFETATTAIEVLTTATKKDAQNIQELNSRIIVLEHCVLKHQEIFEELKIVLEKAKDIVDRVNATHARVTLLENRIAALEHPPEISIEAPCDHVFSAVCEAHPNPRANQSCFCRGPFIAQCIKCGFRP